MDGVRIDKWLWAARFFKTRSLASAQIQLGRVQVNGLLAKPARELHVGDEVRIQQAGVTRCVVVQALSAQRGSASQASTMYLETADSIQARAALAEQRRLSPEPQRDAGSGRPTKQERRAQQKSWGDRWSASLP